MILATDFRDAKFMYERLGVAPSVNFRGMKSVDYAGRIQAMVGFDGWTPNSVFCHIMVEDRKGFTKKFIRECFTHLFLTSNKGLVLVVVPGNNTASLDLTARLGFTEVYRVQDGWCEGTDLILKHMRRDDCRWLRRH